MEADPLLMRFLLLLAALFLDWLIADREPLTHPVVLIGRLIEELEEYLLDRRGRSFSTGLLLTISTLLITCFFTLLLGRLLGFIHFLPRALFDLYIYYTGLAAGSLARSGRRLAGRLQRDNLPAARALASGLITRDTDKMDEEDLCRAGIETVAENLNDAVIAPLLFSFIFGPVGMIAYKTIDTLDSMIGYDNREYAELGRAAARLDDLASWIPARLTAFTLIFAALLPGYSASRSWKTMRSDSRLTKSPNAGYPEAAMAGALGVRLGGPDYYFGQLVEKPYLGESLRPATPAALLGAVKLIYITEIIFFLAAGYLLLRWLAFLPLPL